jgi:hypothetical protein
MRRVNHRIIDPCFSQALRDARIARAEGVNGFANAAVDLSA